VHDESSTVHGARARDLEGEAQAKVIERDQGTAVHVEPVEVHFQEERVQ
jgi:hypothetical protein